MKAFSVALALMAVAGSAHAESIRLTCSGMASQLQGSTTFGSVSGDVDVNVNAAATNYRIGQTPDRLLVEISDTGGRIRPPKVILPPMRGKGAGNGWWTLEDLSIGDTEITGKFRLNVLNNPTVRIDRTTGSIEVAGYAYTRFTGTCEVADPSNRKF